MKTWQKGFISTEIAIGVFAATLIFAAFIEIQRNEIRESTANIVGVRAGQVNNAIRAYITDNGATTPETTTPITDLSFFKDTSCPSGTSSIAYLPCDFPSTLDLGLSYNISITNTAGTVNSTMTLGIPNIGDVNIPYLAGQVVDAANKIGGTSSNASNTYFNATNDTAGNITLTASNTPDVDIYLRRDGTNQPTGSFDWNTQSITNMENLGTNTVTFNDGATGVSIDSTHATLIDDLKNLNCPVGVITHDSATNTLQCAAVLSGMIAAFNQSCPSGWTAFTESTGRFLVGAGNWTSAPGSGGEQEPTAWDNTGVTAQQDIIYALNDTGGSAFQTLIGAELPSSGGVGGQVTIPGFNEYEFKMNPRANAQIQLGLARLDGGQSTNINLILGVDKPHENRPPYIAVNWCQKD